MTSLQPVSARAPARSGPATLVGLGAGLRAAVPLWWISGGTSMSVRDFRRWMLVVAACTAAVLALGGALMGSVRTRPAGVGLVVGTLWAVLADLTWWSLAAHSAAD